MTVARSVADVLAARHVEVECIDRMYLNVYQPRLQHAGGVRGSCAVIGGTGSPRRR
jgi:hypothetical protein